MFAAVPLDRHARVGQNTPMDQMTDRPAPDHRGDLASDRAAGAGVRLGFELPPGLLGRFGIVKLWPEIKVAEDEVIARLRNTARQLGLGCVVVDQLGHDIEYPHAPLTRENLDFVIHLHFSTPKCYDIFSFVVLWNPTEFMHMFGYRPMVRNLLSHDDFLSCSSPAADDQVRRLISGDPSRALPEYTMYHSLSDPIHPPKVGDGKLFYCGINWERLGNQPSRHQAVLDRLDKTGLLRIFGPQELRGVRVWDGYSSYEGELPFDGVATIQAIHRAGMCLALSSDAHKNAGLMSNRLFEGLAAGAVIICDENSFARTHFGDSLLYVDMRDDPAITSRRIVNHVEWVIDNPEQAVELAGRAQEIFCRRFRLDVSLQAIYEGFPSRRAAIERLAGPDAADCAVDLFFLVPRWDRATVRQHVDSLRGQRRRDCRATLVVDARDLQVFGPEIRRVAAESADFEDVIGMTFFDRDTDGHAVGTVRLGVVLRQLCDRLAAKALVCFVGPNEKLFENHLLTLAGALSRAPDAGHAYAEVLLPVRDAAGINACQIQEPGSFLGPEPMQPIGLARFLFRLEAVRDVVGHTLPYLDLRATAGLAFVAPGVASNRATVALDPEHDFLRRPPLPGRPGVDLGAAVREELECIRDLDHEAYDRAGRSFAAFPSPPAPTTVLVQTEHLRPQSIYLDGLTRTNQQIFLAQLLKSLPIPRFVWKMLRPLRPWRNRRS